ncbi:response regulator [Microbacterium sp.]|uniref:response regulator n=1 Tax=Microbacterium sp. TaxID=51671 RepID=UPI0037C8635F
MAIARLHGGPLDGQLLPLEQADLEQLIAPYGEGQIVYKRGGDLQNTGDHDGPTTADFWYLGSTEDINPDPDGRDE